jgi:uncharacterized protein DUF5318
MAMRTKPARRQLGRSRRSELGVIDYTLAKRALLRDAQRGLLGLTDLCDAHPELIRAAKYVGEPTSNDCPVCGREKLVLLAYVYGDDLRQDNGRVWSIETGMRLAATHPGARCYVVEVCRGCQWNHLHETLTARRAAAGYGFSSESVGSRPTPV